MSAYYVKGDPVMASHTPGDAVAAGEMVVVGSEVRICHHAIAANEVGNLAVPGGNVLYDVDKEAGGGVTFADGAEVFLDEANQLAVATDGGGANEHLGTAVAAAGDNDTSVRIVHDKVTL